MVKSTLTLELVYELFDRHVPPISRSAQVNRESTCKARAVSWWPAHELGHLAVAKPREVFEAEFGIGDSHVQIVTDHYSRCKELAAMHVSSEILTMCGEAGDRLHDSERLSTDGETLTWPTFGLTTRMLRAHSAERIPQTFKALDGYFAAKVEAGRLWVARRAKHARRGHARIGASLRAYA